MDERIYMVSAEDEASDHHVFITNDRERALAAYQRLEKQYGAVMSNDAVAEALLAGATGRADEE